MSNSKQNQPNLHPLIFDVDYYIETLIRKLLNKGHIEPEEADDLYTLAYEYKKMKNSKA